jgi:hypothetical protein
MPDTEWAPFQQVHETLKGGQAVYIGPSGRRYSLRLINPRLPSDDGATVLAQVDEAVGPQARAQASLTPMSEELRHVRVFLSSPGDVKQERALAHDLIKSSLPVNDWLRGRMTFDLVSWDDPSTSIPMPADLTPQEAINRGLRKPSECDVVIVLLWSRMGTPLPTEYTKLDGSPYYSGTEWEFEDALTAARRTNGKPMVLLYRRTQKPQIDIDDADFEAKRDQFRLVNKFFDNLRDPDGSIRCSVNNYDSPEDFRLKLDRHLQHYAKRLLDGARSNPISGFPGVVAAARDAFRGFEWKPSSERDLDFAELRRQLDALDRQNLEASRDEIRALVEMLERIVPRGM